jgi:leucyl aminopeptidase
MIQKINKLRERESILLFLDDPGAIPAGLLSEVEKAYMTDQRTKNEKDCVILNRYDRMIIIQFTGKDQAEYLRMEFCRKEGDKIQQLLNDNKIKQVILYDCQDKPVETLALAEGMALGNYQFLKYKKDAATKRNSLVNILILSKKVSRSDVNLLDIIVSAVFFCRDLVNEPPVSLTSVTLAETLEKMGTSAGMKVEVFHKKKIETLKMGGLLAVNRGSAYPPTFTIMEWHPAAPVNSNPVILVGKGIVFDAGGLSLKPPSGMETMKDDMAGAAAVASTAYAVARAHLPVHVIALIPSTDNRPDSNAYAPGDVITMYDGSMVEVLNTDAEGRMILADALSYAKQYDPELVIDVATLTGSAAMAIGKYGIVTMNFHADDNLASLKESSMRVFERLVEFPTWEEYKELLKSEIADIKNIGGKEAGAITAGLFLEHFTGYPYIHLDIAGSAFSEKKDSYRGTGGTGVTVRLLFDFIRQKCS